MADKLHLSEQTVKTLPSGIYRKLDVHSRMETVTVARRNGMIRPDE